MKKYILFVLISTLSIISYGQKCNLKIDKLDAFTNEHVKSGTNAIGGRFWNWNLTLTKKGEKYEWAMQIKWGKHFQEPIKKGEIFYCKLEDGTIVKFICDNEYAPSHVAASGFITTTYLPKGVLEKADIKSLSTSSLSEMRVMLSGENLEPKISSKQGESIKEIARCLIQ